MADLLEQGSAWLEDQRNAHMSRSVLYTRQMGPLATFVNLLATVGKTELEQADDFGIVHRIQSRDYLVLVTDLILGGEQSLPKAGDGIQETVGDKTFRYEVMAPRDLIEKRLTSGELEKVVERALVNAGNSSGDAPESSVSSPGS